MKKLLLLVGLVVFLTPMVVSAEEIKFKCDCKEKLGSIYKEDFYNKKLIDRGCYQDEFVVVKFNHDKQYIKLGGLVFENSTNSYFENAIEIREEEIFAYIDEINGDGFRMVVLNRYDGTLVHKNISPGKIPYEITQDTYLCTITNKLF